MSAEQLAAALDAVTIRLPTPIVRMPQPASAHPSNLSLIRGLQQRGVRLLHENEGVRPGPVATACPVCRQRAFIEPEAPRPPFADSIWCEGGCDEALVTDRIIALSMRPFCPYAGDRDHYSRHCADCVQASDWARAEADRRTYSNDALTGWEPLNLADAEELPTPSVLRPRGGDALLTAGFLHGFHGKPETGKTRLLYLGVAEQVKDGNAALIIDYEMGLRQAKEALLGFGLSTEQLREQVVFLMPDAPIDERGRAAIRTAVEATGRPLTLALIDSVSESMTGSGLSDDSTNDVAAWHQALPGWIVREWPGCASVHIDHLAKQAANPLDPIGSQRKRSGVDVQYLVKAVEPFSREREGYSDVVVSKHRAGTATRGTTVARLVGGPEGFELLPVDHAAQRALSMDERILEWFSHAEGRWEPSAEARKGVRGDNAVIADSLRRLTGAGQLELRKNGRRDEYRVTQAEAES